MEAERLPFFEFADFDVKRAPLRTNGVRSNPVPVVYASRNRRTPSVPSPSPARAGSYAANAGRMLESLENERLV